VYTTNELVNIMELLFLSLKADLLILSSLSCIFR